MEKLEATVAITGMNATDNPAPGVAVARCLRDEPGFSGRIIGLGYDPLDPGFYARGLLDGGAVMPYPSAGREAMLAQLLRVQKAFGLDVLLPTLDSELRAVARIEGQLERYGIRTFAPRLESIEAVSKAQLFRLGQRSGFPVPESEAIVGAEHIPRLIERFGLPIVVKGVYYGASIAHSEVDAVAAFHQFVASWGLPVVVQRFVRGEEYNVAGLGDGEGALVGAVAMRKMMLTDKGKGWAGVTVGDPELVELSRRVARALRWRGGLEVEFLKESATGRLFVAEVNPRFPAWVYLAAGAGQNLPYACAELALGQQVSHPLPPYRVGVQFVRISLDQIGDLSTYSQLSSSGFFEPGKESTWRP